MLGILIPTPGNLYLLHSCSVNLRWLKMVHDYNNFLNTVIATVMHHVFSCHWSVHGVASSSGTRRLTNEYVSEYSFGLSSVPVTYLVVAGTIGLLLLISLGVVFSRVTLMPRWNLGPHVRCSHMIEPLGARRCLGMCDVTHYNPLLCNPY